MKQILVVDDELDVKALFSQMFRREIRKSEINLVFAHSTEEALTHLSECTEAYDILLSDINMPGKSGLVLLQEVKVQWPQLEVFMLSAYGDEATIEKARGLGASEFIPKPIDFQLVKQHIFRNEP